MKIALVEPNLGNEGLSYGWLPKAPLLGIVYLGTILEKQGHEVEIYKENIKKPDYNNLDVDILCISIMSCTANRGYEIARLFKKNNPDKKVIIGGSHATFMPEEALKYADQVIVREAESVISKILTSKEKIIKGKPADLDKLPFPDFSLVKGLKLPLPRTPIQTSRGCPFNCNFCTVTKMFGRKYRFRKPENVIKEIMSRKHKKIFFYDDNFCAMPSKTKEILKLMLKNKINVPWVAQVRVEVANDDELLNLMAKTNCYSLYIGFESVNPETLKEYNKAQELDSIKKCIKKLKEHGIGIHGMFVLGSDHDDKNTFKQTINFCDKMNIDSVQFSVLTPFPGTDTYKKLKSENRIFTKDWSLYDGEHVVFKPKKMKAVELQNEISKIWKKAYWFNKRGARYFFHNLDSCIKIFVDSARWGRKQSGYKEYLRGV